MDRGGYGVSEEDTKWHAWQPFVSESYAIIGIVVGPERVVVSSYAPTDTPEAQLPRLDSLDDMPEDIVLFAHNGPQDDQKLKSIGSLVFYARCQGYLPGT